eukprot:6673986-Pyramimonas_sp.AAC.1
MEHDGWLHADLSTSRNALSEKRAWPMIGGKLRGPGAQGSRREFGVQDCQRDSGVQGAVQESRVQGPLMGD